VYYKVVRRSQVTLELVRAADGHVAWSTTGARRPGTYKKTFTRRLGDGKWRWTVSAVDHKGRSSAMDRTFTANDTLGYLKLSRTLLRPTKRGGRLDISFRLSRSAHVAVTVRKPSGGIVRHLASTAVGPGRAVVRWNVRNDAGHVVRDGRYIVRVGARNDVGTVALAKGLRVRRRY